MAHLLIEHVGSYSQQRAEEQEKYYNLRSYVLYEEQEFHELFDKIILVILEKKSFFANNL